MREGMGSSHGMTSEDKLKFSLRAVLVGFGVVVALMFTHLAFVWNACNRMDAALNRALGISDVCQDLADAARYSAGEADAHAERAGAWAGTYRQMQDDTRCLNEAQAEDNAATRQVIEEYRRAWIADAVAAVVEAVKVVVEAASPPGIAPACKEMITPGLAPVEEMLRFENNPCGVLNLDVSSTKVLTYDTTKGRMEWQPAADVQLSVGGTSTTCLSVPDHALNQPAGYLADYTVISRADLGSAYRVVQPAPKVDVKLLNEVPLHDMGECVPGCSSFLPAIYQWHGCVECQAQGKFTPGTCKRHGMIQ